MIKKSTLIVLLCAIVAVGGVFYFQRRKSRQPSAPVDTTKPAFSLNASDIVSFSFSHPAEKDQPSIDFEKQKGAWQIVRPVDTPADEPTAEGFVDQLAEARPSSTEPITTDRRKAFGLDPPAASVEFRTAGGRQHTLLLGDKDFSGDDVYAIVDGQPKVSLLPLSLLTTADKSLKDLRDMSVLHIDSADVSSFTLKNPSGDLAVTRDAKDSTLWNFTEPEKAAADADVVDGILDALSSARISDIVSEKPENLARYGLATPAIAFSAAKTGGGQSSLVLGKKDGDGYYARDLSRPMIFKVQQDLYAKLADDFSQMRDKTVVRIDETSLDRIRLQNSNGAIEISRLGTGGQWKIVVPAADKGKSASSWKILNPFTSLRADAVIDRPSAIQLAAMRSPAVTAVLTKNSGQTVTVRISEPSGGVAYAQSSESPELFKIKKQTVDDLNLKASDVAF